MLPLGPSSDSTPDGGGGLRARWAAYLGRVRFGFGFGFGFG